MCWGESVRRARETALEWWPNGGLSGNLFIEHQVGPHGRDFFDFYDHDVLPELD